MDVARPISTAIPTLDGPVLQALARTTRPLTGRQVHRLAGAGSEAGVRKVLSRLVVHGMVHVASSGQALLYVANRDHVAWPSVDALTRLRETLLDRLREEIGTWMVSPIVAAMFGSAARGDGTVTSDIDLLIVRPTTAGDPQWQEQVDRLREHTTAWTGNRCQIYEVDVDEFGEHVRGREPIVAEWQRDAVFLHGHPLARLATEVDKGDDVGPPISRELHG